MSENIFNSIDFLPTRIEYKKLKFFQACNWENYSLKFKLHRRNRILSKKDALIDFEVFKYALNNLYCGKPIHEKSGVDFEDCYKQIEEYIETSKKIRAKDLCDEYAKALNNKFVDNHLHFLLPMDKNNPVRLPTRKNYLPYFTGITVEKCDEIFKVVSSESEKVKTGDIIKNTGCMFKTLPYSNRKYYLVGCRSWEKRESMEIVCNGNPITVKLHLCRIAENENQDIVFSHYNNGLDIIRTNTFVSSADKKTLEKAAVIGKNLKNSKTIIFDMHHNGGGNSLYSATFFENLNGYCEEEPYSCAELMTPYHKKFSQSNTKEWIIHNKKDIDLQKGKYNGKVIILTDYYCGSSAEETINFTKSLKNTVRVGTNTNGCNCFTNLWVCILPKTHMAMYLPNIAFLDMFEEGKGFEPDYWLDTTEPLQEIIKWLNETK